MVDLERVGAVAATLNPIAGLVVNVLTGVGIVIGASLYLDKSIQAGVTDAVRQAAVQDQAIKVEVTAMVSRELLEHLRDTTAAIEQTRAELRGDMRDMRLDLVQEIRAAGKR